MSNLIEAARGSRKTVKFSVRKMNSVIDDVVNKLDGAIKKQNPECDADSIESDVRALVMKHGGGNTMETTAAVVDPAPQYNLAADILVLAHTQFTAGDIQGALKRFVTAMESDGINELVAALDDANAQTDVQFQALASMAEEEFDQPEEDEDESDESDEDESDENESEDEDEEVTSSDEEPDDEADDEEEVTSEVADEEESEEDEEVTSSESEDEDEDEDGDTDLDDEITAAINAVTTEFSSEKITKERRALLNKMSLSGKQTQRNLARKLT